MKIGFTASAFDVGPHAGHVAMLKEAKQHCDYLVVALHVNPNYERTTKNTPIPSVSQRWFSLHSNVHVNEIIPYETEEELIELLKLVHPHVRFLGEDYKDKDFTGKDLEIPIHFCKRRHNVSSSGLRKKIISQGTKG